jgi:hypothetical protein
MSMTTEKWLQAIRGVIAKIADKDFQERAWTGKGPEVSSPDEMYCQLFDDLMIEAFVEQVELTPAQTRGIETLIEKMETVPAASPDSIDEKLLLADPKWHEVREFAKELYQLLAGARSENSS